MLLYLGSNLLIVPHHKDPNSDFTSSCGMLLRTCSSEMCLSFSYDDDVELRGDRVGTADTKEKGKNERLSSCGSCAIYNFASVVDMSGNNVCELKAYFPSYVFDILHAHGFRGMLIHHCWWWEALELFSCLCSLRVSGVGLQM